MAHSKTDLTSRRRLLKEGMSIVGLSFVLPSVVGPEVFGAEGLIKGIDRQLQDVGGDKFNQESIHTFGWRVQVEEGGGVKYDIVANNQSPFSDPGRPSDHQEKAVRIIRAKPQFCGATSNCLHIEDRFTLPRGKDKVVASNLGFDNDDQFFVLL